MPPAVTGPPPIALAVSPRVSGLRAADRHSIAGLAVLWVLQREVVQRHVERWPQANLGRASDRQPISGFALNPVLYLRGQETGGYPDDQKQCGDDEDGSECGAGAFHCSHDECPNRASL